MNSQIWKFGPLYPSVDRWQSISIDEFAYPIHFGEQHGQLFFWAEVNPAQGQLMRDFMVIPTGVDTPEYGRHLFSLVASDGTVWHLYEKC